MRFSLFCVAALGAAVMFLDGCSSAPGTNSDRTELNNDTQAALSDFKTRDPSLDNLLNSSYGFAIFPSVGKGAVGVGGAYGQGEVYQQGKRVGYADVTQASVGASIGGQTFDELIVFRISQALQNFESAPLTFTADISAVAAKAGAADNAKWANDIAIFTDIKGGLMGDAAVGGQKFQYTSL
jgi:lipid-binding SYLF domain-containing protein